MGLFHGSLLLKIRVSISQLFLGMDVIGSFMTHDAFVAVPSVLTCKLTESVSRKVLNWKL